MDRSILYIDGDEKSREKIAELIKGKDALTLHTASNIAEAVSILEEHGIKCVLADYSFEDGTANDVLEAASEQDLEPIPILFTDKDFDDIPTEQMVAFSAYVSKDNSSAYEKAVDEIDSLLQSQSTIDYPVPENEEARLKHLERYDVEELAESGDFDRLCRLGAELFDTRWCFVGLVTEDRERFLSFVGSDTEELKRSCTICTFAINQDDVMVVEDREKDPRFKYVDELDDLGIKWYAGAPLVTEDGYNIGSFCVADTEKREFGEDEREILKLLAEEAVEKVKLKHEASETVFDKLRKLI